MRANQVAAVSHNQQANLRPPLVQPSKSTSVMGMFRRLRDLFPPGAAAHSYSRHVFLCKNAFFASDSTTFLTTRRRTRSRMIYWQVRHNLWHGSAPGIEEHFRRLQSLKISAILSLQDETDISYGGTEYERAAAVRAGFAFESFPIKEFNDTELQQRLPEAVESLAGLLRKGHSVYIHCNLGTTRSPAVVAAYHRAELTALSRTPRSLPGKVLPLPYACGICGSDKIGYDRLNVVTCGNCDAVLAPSGRWLVSSLKPTL